MSERRERSVGEFGGTFNDLLSSILSPRILENLSFRGAIARKAETYIKYSTRGDFKYAERVRSPKGDLQMEMLQDVCCCTHVIPSSSRSNMVFHYCLCRQSIIDSQMFLECTLLLQEDVAGVLRVKDARSKLKQWVRQLFWRSRVDVIHTSKPSFLRIC